MILEKKPFTIAEVNDIVKDLDERQQLKDYLKTFMKLSKQKADELRKKLENLNSHKVREEHIVKIIDILPIELEDLNKIITEITLSLEESTQILDIVKEYSQVPIHKGKNPE